MPRSPLIIAIVGPTASGKSEAAFKLAGKIPCEIVSCDSMLVYDEPALLTAKPHQTVLDKVKHHFVGVVPVTQSYSVYDYYCKAGPVIEDIIARGLTPVVCGGTGLYLKALLDGLVQGPPRDEELRTRLNRQVQVSGGEALLERLRKVDPETAGRLYPNDTKRIVRALEVYELTGTPLSQRNEEQSGLWDRFPCRVFGLGYQREELYNRINKRTDSMFYLGVVEEVKRLRGLAMSDTASKMIGLAEIGQYLSGEMSLEEAKETMKKNTRNFAKRQMTWFRAEKRIEWIDCDMLDSGEIAEKIENSVISD